MSEPVSEVRDAPRTLEQIRADTRGVLSECLGAKNEAALLDFPNHQNVGDSMIWAGERVYMRQLGVHIRYAADMPRYSRRQVARLPENAVILLHGGGNFGDLWPEYQEFRERVVQDFPDRTIIQLPQSIRFSSAVGWQRANEMFGSHQDFRLLVRDWTSYDQARLHLPDVQVGFCHDMALGWSPPHGDGTTVRRAPLLLARRDREVGVGVESVVSSLFPEGAVDVADWGLRGIGAVIWRLARLPGVFARLSAVLRDSRLYYPALAVEYEILARLNCSAGVRKFQSRSLVATDRLHAYVLALLLDIPVLIVDNSYGKIGAVRDASTRNLGGVFATGEESSSEADSLREVLLGLVRSRSVNG